MLIAAGANVNTRSDDPKSCTPLIAAACSNSVLVVKSLIDHGADVHAIDSNNDSVLETALLHGGQDTVHLLLEVIGGKDYPKESVAVQFAMARDHATVLSLIVTASAMYSHFQNDHSDRYAWIEWVLEQGGDLVKPMAKVKM